MRRRFALLLVPLLALGCFSTGDGPNPPLEQLYFPVGLALSPQASRLWVVNSDFDLQYDSGSLQAWNLETLDALLPEYCESEGVCDCGELGEKSAAERLLAPGRCGPIDPVGRGIIVGAVGISAFATDVIFRRDPTRPPSGDAEPAGRLFVPARGDATLNWIDVDPASGSELACGGEECDDDHRRGDDPENETTRPGLRMPSEPFGIAASDDGEAVLVTHQVDGQVSLFVNQWAEVGSGPKLEFVLGGLASGAVGITAVPQPGLVHVADVSYQPGFLISFRNAAELRLLRYHDDAAAAPNRPFISTGNAVAITANAAGFDSRGIVYDTSERRACEAGCLEQSTGLAACVSGCEAQGPRYDGECLIECGKSAGVPQDVRACFDECAGVAQGVYVSNRAPSTLLVGKTRANSSATSSDDVPRIYDAIPVGFGASRVVAGHVKDENGDPLLRVFVVCFDARSIYVYSPEGRRVERVIHTGRGPHALVIDEKRALGYVGHFTDSYVGVIDLDQRHRQSYGEIIATVGVPSPPRSSK